MVLSVKWHIIFCFICISVCAQTTSRTKYLSMKDGMSQVSVNDMIRDSQGFVWIGTADGLNRYDGNIFKQYRNNPKDSLSLSGNFITKIVEGENGLIWVGTRGKGLCLYNPLEDAFKNIKLVSNKKDETITGIDLDRNGSVLVSTFNNGLIKLTSNNKDFIKERFLSNENISAIFKDKKDILWTGGLNGEVSGFTDQLDKPYANFNVEGNVQCFFSAYNYLFIGTYDGFFTYNFETEEVKSIELEDSGNFKTMHVVDFLKEDETHVWIATGRGLYLFDYLNFNTENKVEYQEKKGQGLSNNTVQSLLRVAPNLIYVGTANELTCLDFNPSSFRNISKDRKGQQVLNDNVIFSIYKDENLWIGTSDGGLNLITEDKIYHYIDNQNNPTTIAGSVVRAIVHDKINDRMWFATSRGLSMLNLKTFNPDKPVFKNFYHNPNNPNSINSDFLKDLVLDKNNTLWGATHTHGIFRLEYTSSADVSITRYTSNKENKNTLVNDEINCLELDRDHNIWVGTQNGISKINIDDENYHNINFFNYDTEGQTSNGLSHKSVNDILVDDQNRVWIGTREGLNLLNEDNSFTSWAKHDQFPNTLIYSVQDDSDGNLWIGTNDGLVNFNTTNEQFSHYGTLDNIQGREFDTHARFKDSLGYVYMGGIEGVTYFHPNDLKNTDTPQNLYFSQLQIKEDIIKPKEDGSPIEKSIENTFSLMFDYNQFPFYLKFSALDFRFDKNVKYAFRLLPLDQEWRFLNDTEIQFLSLPVGEYELQVNGFSRGKEWVKPPLSIKLKVNPPWWFTHLALASYILIGALLVYWFYRFQISRKLALAESKRLKEIDKLKNSLYTNITHEFRTPITVILGMVDILETKIKNTTKETEKPLKLIKQNSEGLLKMVNNMLDLAKLESAEMQLDMMQDDVVSYIRYVFENFETLAHEKQISYTFYSEVDEVKMDFDANKLSTILTNLIINAIKFTPKNGKIICHVKVVQNNLLSIKIVDTGVGIPQEDVKNIFEKFYQVNSSTASQLGGSGIGLALTKELIGLMNGTITVTSKVGKGSEFIVELPITNGAKISNSEVKPKQPKQQNDKIDLSIENNNTVLNIDENDLIALIIEDNKDVAYYLKSCLQENYKIIYAENGVDGIEMALKFIPDIIISDVMMPLKDGFEVCETLKTEIATNHIPIILLTAKATEKDRIEGLNYGADAYLVKPFNKKELFTRINQLISLRKKMISKFSKEDYKDFIKRNDNNPETIFVKKVIDALNEEMDNPEFGATQLASKMHLSESQVYRKIKAVTNRSTSVFIRSLRLNKAKMLLQTTDKTVSQIAYEVGFNDPSWFSRAFKEEFNQSPSEVGKH